jgi:peptide chain release factor 1
LYQKASRASKNYTNINTISSIYNQHKYFETKRFYAADKWQTVIKGKVKDMLSDYVTRYNAIQTDLASGSLPPKEIIKLTKEASSLTPLVHAFQEFEAKYQELNGLQAMLDESKNDPELQAMTKEEITSCSAAVKDYEKSLILKLLPKDEADEGDAIIEIRAGTGGLEASLFANDLLRMYQLYADIKGHQYEVLSVSDSDVGGIRDAIALMKGSNVFGKIKYESGVHRVQRMPATDTTRIHTSTATVAVFPDLGEDVDFELKASDIRIDFYRAGGAGGQHVNKTDSAVRLTHIPTGVVVAIQDQRSQHQNKARAMKILKSRVYAIEQEKVKGARDAQRKSQIGSAERSERIRTYNFPQDRVTDHRVGITLHNVESMLNGELLDDFHTALVAQDESESLRYFLENEVEKEKK